MQKTTRTPKDDVGGGNPQHYRHERGGRDEDGGGSDRVGFTRQACHQGPACGLKDYDDDDIENIHTKFQKNLSCD